MNLALLHWEGMWNSLTLLGAFLKFAIGSQGFYSGPYPFHETKFCFLPRPLNLESKISWTSHSKSPSGVIIGGGGFYLRLGIVSCRYLSRSDAWKTSWICSDFGNFNVYTKSKILVTIGNGPKKFDANILDGVVVAIFSCWSNTLSPTSKFGCRWQLRS